MMEIGYEGKEKIEPSQFEDERKDMKSFNRKKEKMFYIDQGQVKNLLFS